MAHKQLARQQLLPRAKIPPPLDSSTPTSSNLVSDWPCQLQLTFCQVLRLTTYFYLHGFFMFVGYDAARYGLNRPPVMLTLPKRSPLS